MTAAYDWTGRVGDIWADEWRRTDRSFAALEPQLEAAILAVVPTTGRLFDIGCGAGTTSRAIASARPQAAVIGADLSGALLAVAARRHADVPNLALHHGDAVALAIRAAPLDCLFSRHGVMFFADPVEALGGLRAATAPGGHIVFSCFRAPDHNPWSHDLLAAVTGADPAPTAAEAPGPFAFADPDRVARILGDAGWTVDDPQVADFDYVAGEGEDPVADAAAYLHRIGPTASALRELPPAQFADARARLHDHLVRYRRDTLVVFPASAWIWTAHNHGVAA